MCGKGPQVGNNVSHANNKSKRRWLPNLRRVRAVQKGQGKYIQVRTRGLRSGRVVKPAGFLKKARYKKNHPSP